MHIFGHLVVSILYSFLALGDSSIALYGAFLAGAVLIDLDHFAYAVVAKKTLSPKRITEYLQAEYKTHTPHIYIFHTVEVMMVLFVIGIFFSRDHDASLLFAFVNGMGLHLCIDFLSYLWIKRSFRGWLRHFSLFGMLLSRL